MSAPRMTPNRIARIAQQLSVRDYAIVASLNRVRVATGRQLEQLHFYDSTPETNARLCRRSLKRLVDLQVLIRLDRRIGGVRAGSAGFVYALDIAGQHLANARGPVNGRRMRRPWTPSTPFIAHALAVTELYVQLVLHARRGNLDLLTFDTEPGCWRTFLDPRGGRAILKPDAFTRVGLGEFEDAWFIEVDRATEPRPILSKKLDLYRQYWSSGREQARTGLFPRVLILVPTPARHASLVDLVGRQPVDAWRLFRVALYQHGADILAGETPT